MTSEDPYEDDFLNLRRTSDTEDEVRDSGRPRPMQPAARSKEKLSLRHFNGDAFLDVPNLEHDPPETVELLAQEEPTPERPFPAIIDVFLFPFGKAGLATLSIMLGTPTVLILVAVSCVLLRQAAPLLLLIAAPIAIIGGMVALGMMLYFGWYLSECVRDSATGGIRAPDTMGMTPGLMDMFAQNFQLLVCAAVCGGMYSSTVHSLSMNRITSWALGGTIAFLFPMTLLRVIMSESLQSLLPVGTLRLIARTCVPYCALVLALCVLPGLGYVLFRKTTGWPLLALIMSLGLYICLVSAHLLGRFAWHCRDRLDWE